MVSLALAVIATIFIGSGSVRIAMLGWLVYGLAGLEHRIFTGDLDERETKFSFSAQKDALSIVFVLATIACVAVGVAKGWLGTIEVYWVIYAPIAAAAGIEWFTLFAYVFRTRIVGGA